MLFCLLLEKVEENTSMSGDFSLVSKLYTFPPIISLKKMSRGRGVTNHKFRSQASLSKLIDHSELHSQGQY